MTFPNRALLDKELNEIRTNSLKLAGMVDYAIENAMEALYSRNSDLAQKVIVQDEEINVLRYEIEDHCLRVLATQQPAAGDLRTVIAAIHIAVELERMGDHASGIASLVNRMEADDELNTLHKLPKMAKRAREMAQKGIEAYVNADAEQARHIISRDDKLDKQYSKLFRETLEEMREDDYIRRATFLLWVGHNLERIGDRATNIAERVIFMITNEHIENSDNIE